MLSKAFASKPHNTVFPNIEHKGRIKSIWHALISETVTEHAKKEYLNLITNLPHLVGHLSRSSGSQPKNEKKPLDKQENYDNSIRALSPGTTFIIKGLMRSSLKS